MTLLGLITYHFSQLYHCILKSACLFRVCDCATWDAREIRDVLMGGGVLGVWEPKGSSSLITPCSLAALRLMGLAEAPSH